MGSAGRPVSPTLGILPDERPEYHSDGPPFPVLPPESALHKSECPYPRPKGLVLAPAPNQVDPALPCPQASVAQGPPPTAALMPIPSGRSH